MKSDWLDETTSMRTIGPVYKQAPNLTILHVGPCSHSDQSASGTFRASFVVGMRCTSVAAASSASCSASMGHCERYSLSSRFGRMTPRR